MHRRYVPPPLSTNRHHCPLEHGPRRIRCEVPSRLHGFALSKLCSKRRHDAEGSFQQMHRQQGGTKNLLVLITIHSTANLHREKRKLGCRGRERGASRGEDRQRAVGANGAAGPSERGGKPFLPALPLTLELRGCS